MQTLGLLSIAATTKVTCDLFGAYNTAVEKSVVMGAVLAPKKKLNDRRQRKFKDFKGTSSVIGRRAELR
jgi:hypothetical protein